MFELSFKSQLSALTKDKNIIENLWEEIRNQYSGSGRHYHNLTHLDHIHEELIAVKKNISEWQTLTFSIAYHDFIYNPLKSDNEERSAEFAYKKLTSLNSSDTQRNKCFAQIMATKGHAVSKDADTNFFMDADLAILGASREGYQHYMAAIRKEYKMFPGFVYKRGRRKVLQYFLQMKDIFKTEYFHEKYETQARANLEFELELISR